MWKLDQNAHLQASIYFLSIRIKEDFCPSSAKYKNITVKRTFHPYKIEIKFKNKSNKFEQNEFQFDADFSQNRVKFYQI